MGLGLYALETPGPHHACRSGVLCRASSFRRVAWEDSSADMEPGTSKHQFSGVAFMDKCQRDAEGVLGAPTGTQQRFILFRQGHKDPLSTAAILTVSNRKGISSDTWANLDVEQTERLEKTQR